MDALGIKRAIFAGHNWGGRAACVAAALWPERCNGMVTVNSYHIQDFARAMVPIDPQIEAALWYEYYFQIERGRAGLAANRREIARILWEDWSPDWDFDDDAFDRTAAAYDNPDFVDVVIHSYRVRYGYVAGDPALAAIEAKLALKPKIGVPTITLQGDDIGSTLPEASAGHATYFTGRYERRLIPRVGHNIPQEAPRETAEAVLDLAGTGLG